MRSKAIKVVNGANTARRGGEQESLKEQLADFFFPHIRRKRIQKLQAEAIKYLRASAYFDAEFYRTIYQDVGAAGIDPVEHYVTVGWSEARFPCPLFDSAWYCATYPAVVRHGWNPFHHFLSIGRSEGLRPNLYFDEKWYLKTHADVREAGVDAILHFTNMGATELRDPGPAFSMADYYRRYPDITPDTGNALVHYLLYGVHDGRIGGDLDTAAVDLAGAKTGSRVSDAKLTYLAGVSSYGVDRTVSKVSRLHTDAPELDAPVKTIAMYLPQFHPIPENDRWWGKGFTEWRNVTRAKPQFIGHYQPHLPAELGFYDLRLREVQEQQAELAKLYGVHGFCLYFYWFGGKTLLETAVDNFASNENIDLPFCLCWANENWSRRWDGLENDVLIAQDHSPEDDINFISHISKYLKNERYIRIDGKPLLIVYRPNLLPSMADTAKRWRDWCRQNGVGDIVLAFTHSFEKCSPSKYGLDYAIEFPPNETAPPKLTRGFDHLNEQFSGTIYDWSVYPVRSRSYTDPGYKLFRGVNPSWDNEARKPGKGTILHGSSPAGYMEWLENATVDTVTRFDDPEERFVFVNAWNEWAEGAHLEPDQRYGYAYLEAHRMALLKAAKRLESDRAPTGGSGKIAAIIHAFYPEILKDILERLSREPLPLSLYVSTPGATEAEVRKALDASGLPYRLFVLPNRGRDVLPFLHTLKAAHRDGNEFVVKLHTKRSKHRKDGDIWRNELLGCLADAGELKWTVEQLGRSPDIGVVGPKGHVLRMDNFWGSNEVAVRALAARFGVTEVDPATWVFVAGTMFVARMQALEPLISIGLNEADFEEEAGQVDGTLAHAIERAISFAASFSGYKIASKASDAARSGGTLVLSSAEDYQFAARSR